MTGWVLGVGLVVIGSVLFSLGRSRRKHLRKRLAGTVQATKAVVVGRERYTVNAGDGASASVYGLVVHIPPDNPTGSYVVPVPAGVYEDFTKGTKIDVYRDPNSGKYVIPEGIEGDRFARFLTVAGGLTAATGLAWILEILGVI